MGRKKPEETIKRSTEHTLYDLNNGKSEKLLFYISQMHAQTRQHLIYILDGKLPVKRDLSQPPADIVHFKQQAQVCWRVAYGIYTGQKDMWIKQQYQKYGKAISILQTLIANPEFKGRTKYQRKTYTHYRTILRRFPNLSAKLVSYAKRLKELCDWDARYKTWLRNHTDDVVAKVALPIDRRLVSFETTMGHYDMFAKFVLTTPRADKPHFRDTVCVGIRQHKRYRKFIDEGWKRKATLMLFEKNGKLMVNFIWEIPVPELVKEIRILGIDMGVNKLMALSNGICLGKLKPLYHKIANCLRGSKRYKGLVKHKNNLVNQLAKRVISLMKAQGYTALQLEQLTLRASRIRGMNKLQYWVHNALVNKLQELLQMEGFHMFRVNPQYTSQTCSRCGDTNKDSRNGESFKCVRCGYECDADINAARNIQELQVDAAKSPLPENQKADLP